MRVAWAGGTRRDQQERGLIAVELYRITTPPLVPTVPLSADAGTGVTPGYASENSNTGR